MQLENAEERPIVQRRPETWIARLDPANGRVKRIARDAGATWIAADTNGVAALARNGLVKYSPIEAPQG